jgi:hypothetical protein
MSTKISQKDVPGQSLEQALRVAQCLADNYASKATTPLNVAAGMDMTPTSGPFRSLTGAAIAYGLTTGGPNAPEIGLTELGKRATRPTSEGDDVLALRQALLQPRVIREFLEKYNGSSLPPAKIAQNVLAEMGVPEDRTEDVLELVTKSAKQYGFTKEIKGKTYIDLSSTPLLEAEQEEDDDGDGAESLVTSTPKAPLISSSGASVASAANADRLRRVFVTHGKNQAFIGMIKKLLSFGELTAVVSVENQSVSKPVPDKVMDDMRSCGAAIIHVDSEQKLIDGEANEINVINGNVLIEIGAAMALYGRRFILLVREGVKLPSNLQGLFEVRYSSDDLSGEATIKLLEAINELKKTPTPQ